MSRCAERRSGRARLVALAALLLACTAPGARSDDVDPAYWLRYGRQPRTCPGARSPVPMKLEGETWGILASGAAVCRDTGDAYAFTLEYLNVSIDPDDHAMLKGDALDFDWIGLALYGPAEGSRSVDWLFDGSKPVKGELRRGSTGRIVFGSLTFTVPKQAADKATRMLFYLTFGGPLVAIDVS